MNKNNRYFSLLFIVTDFMLLNISFFMMNYMKRETLIINPMYSKLLFLFYLVWLIISLFTKKFHVNNNRSYFRSILVYIKSTIFIAYGISFIVVLTGLSLFSRLHIFGTCMMLLTLEILLFTIFYLSTVNNKIDYRKDIDIEKLNKPKISIFLLISDFLLISLAFYLMNFYKRGTFSLFPDYDMILLLIYGLWLGVSNITRKFDKNNFQNYYYALATCIKSAILMVFIMSVLIFAFRLFYFSRLQIFGTLLLLLLFESITYLLYFVSQNIRNINGDIESIEEVHDIFGQKKLTIDNKNKRGKAYAPSFMKIIMNKCLNSYPNIFEFVNNAVDLKKFKDTQISIMSSHDIFNVKILKNSSLRLLMNFHRLNDIRWINRYFLEVHRKLINGGYFVGRAETVETHRKRFFAKYPKYYAELFYIFHFILFRVFPKLPEIKKIYFTFTKGKNRSISMAEVLGRLYFCGFKVLASQEISGSFFFIAVKVKTPSLDQSPSYDPIIKLKRIGLNGQIIFIYKFRTMYPYSEYLQEYIYKCNKLVQGGKIKDDFRITEWGKFMRKYWLDELPMLYNWIRGEIKLFGVRPLSSHYFGLYSKHFQGIRKKIKPGLIPPYYADLPEKFEEIQESEIRYIEAYCKHPLRTQFFYFWNALSNIIFRGVRSR